MNKPLTMIIKDTKEKLANICNESNLPLVVLDLIVQNLYVEVHALAENQTLQEEFDYNKTLKDSMDNNAKNTTDDLVE